MSIPHRLALLALVAGLGQALAQTPEADLTAKLKHAAELQQKVSQALVELATMKEALCPAFQAYLPKADSAYGQWNWECQFSDGSLYYLITDANKRRMATVQFFYHPGGVDPKTRGMHAKCLDLPALRIQNTRVWLLAGKIEMRVEPKDKSLQDDAALDAFVKAFDLAGLAKL